VPNARFDVVYHEGATVGYKWFEAKNHKPLFPFGFGLSYSEFAMSDLKAEVKNGQLTASFTVKNTGALAGKEVAQIYVAPVKAKWEAPKRLGAFKKVNLKSGESTEVTVTVDPRLLGMYDSKSKTWTIAKGEYQVMLATSSAEVVSSVKVKLPKKVLDVKGK
jgi:beta-glucosidase